MNKVLKETLSTAKKLQGKGLIYLDNNIDIGAEINHQIIAMIVENLNILMDEEQYEILKNDKEKLLYELALSSFGEDDLICDLDVDFKMKIIKEFIDLDDPALIGGAYCFITNYVKLRELYEKALIQIEEGKFQNCIF